jgi:monofunctional glycosyltransferase
MAWGGLALLALVALLSIGWVASYRWTNPTGPSAGVWRSITSVPQSLSTMVVLSEDARFCKHTGFDWASVHSALIRAKQGERLVGASTISQQVAKNVFLWQGRSWFRKGLEAWFTFLLESFWSKSRILEVYLNIAQWGPNIVGVDALLVERASKLTLVGRETHLDLFDAAELAVLLPSPLRYRHELPDSQKQKSRALVALSLSPEAEKHLSCFR